MTIHIDVKTGLERLKRAVKDKKLGYHIKNNGLCMYRYDEHKGHACAIGSMMTAKQVDVIEANHDLGTSLRQLDLKFTGVKGDYGTLYSTMQCLQAAHDGACAVTPSTRATKLREFKSILKKLTTQYKVI